MVVFIDEHRVEELEMKQNDLVRELREEAEHALNLASLAPKVRKGYYSATADLLTRAANTLEQG